MMQFPNFKTDEALEGMAAEAVKQGEQVRTTVRDLTLKALQTRDLTLEQVGGVVRSVTQGINSTAGQMSGGAAHGAPDMSAMIKQAFAGMDDALLKAVEANKIALGKMTDGGASFEDSAMKKALGELERLEDGFLKGIEQASAQATEQVRQQWSNVLSSLPNGSTMTGMQADDTLKMIAQQMQENARASREMGLRAAHAFTQNYATLVSGVLIGISEALQAGIKPPPSSGGGKKKG